MRRFQFVGAALHKFAALCATLSVQTTLVDGEAGPGTRRGRALGDTLYARRRRTDSTFAGA